MNVMHGPILQPEFTSDARPGNPFATRYTRPGAIPPLDRHGTPLDVATLASRLDAVTAAAIEGPHGHGKSTLLFALAATLHAMGKPVRIVRLRDWHDACTASIAIATAPHGTAVFVDGWERLGLLAGPMRLVARVLRRRLLVTSHRPTGLPVLWKCATTPALLRAIVARVPDHGGAVNEMDIDAAFQRHSGNVRDAVSDLYDTIERRSRLPRTALPS
ncbi:MAG: hypothetical protein LW698_13680 [Planctomycetaceae bacterium]|nr:hypothetical protein [Planctomycetaceae bacterium]